MSTKHTAARAALTVLTGGAHRGARHNLPALADFDEASERHTLRTIYVDPIPGRAGALAHTAQAHGLAADAIEGRIEDVLATRPAKDRAPVILHVDKASAIAHALTYARTNHRPVLAYLLCKFESGQLWGIRIVLGPEDTASYDHALALMNALAAVTIRRGSAVIIGEDGVTADIASESVYRAWFADHARDNLVRLVSGTEPNHAPIEVFDGTTTRPVVTLTATAWADPIALAAQLSDDPPMPLRRGEEFVVAELHASEGIRFHVIRYRKTDGEFRVRGIVALDEATFAALDAEARRRETERLVRAAERSTASRRSPVMTTD